MSIKERIERLLKICYGIEISDAAKARELTDEALWELCVSLRELLGECEEAANARGLVLPPDNNQSIGPHPSQ